MQPSQKRNKNIYILGEGLVGGMLLERFKKETSFNIHSSKEVRDPRITSTPPHKDVERILEEMEERFGSPDIIINAIGVVGKPNVDWCEDHKEETKYGNVDIPVDLAKITLKRKIPLVHISTGCIFSDTTCKVFNPEDTPNFEGSYYSWSKAEGERQLRKLYEENPELMIQIHRIRVPFFAKSDPRNIFNKLLEYKTIVDTPNSMTCLEDYVEWVINRIDILLAVEEYIPSLTGDGFFSIIHAVNKNPISHREIIEFMKEFGEMSIEEKTFITPQELDKITKTPRSNCVLGEEVLPDIRASILRTIKEYASEI